MTSPPAGRPLAHRLFILALVVLVGLVCFQYTKKVLKPRKDGYTQSAILRWSGQLQDMEDGENIHAKYNYPNPPVMAHLLWPISEVITVSPLAGALLWFALKVAMALVSFVWAFRIIETLEHPFPPWAKALTVLVAFRPIYGDLMHGNVNIFILFLVMASLYAFSRGRDLLSGVLLALAIACKVTPTLFLVYFLWKRGWRVLAGSVLGLALFFFLVPSVVFAVQKGSAVEGWDQNWQALTSWFDGMIKPYLVEGVVTPEKENQSLPGVLTRLLTRSPSFSTWLEDTYVPLAYHNVADVAPGTVKRIVQACQVLFLVLMVLVCRAPIRAAGKTALEARRGWRLAAEFSLILVAMLLFSERTWKHHCVTLVLPFAVVCYGLGRGFPDRMRRTAAVTLVVTNLLIMSTITGVFGNPTPKAAETFAAMRVVVGPAAFHATFDVAAESGSTADVGLIPDAPGKIVQAYGPYTAMFIAFLVGLSLMLAARRPPDAAKAA
jgi:hypothetical protein